MNIYIAYLISALSALCLAMAIVLISRKALGQLLVELCGNDARARYWTLFCGLFLVLCTLYGVLAELPAGDARSSAGFPGLLAGLLGFRAGVLALLLAFMGTALVLVVGIHRFEARK
jgi:hypothetical protein